jgi:hypothetical protein
MQHYGLILADNGSNWYFQGEAINNWDDGFISDLNRIPASAFEAVDESSLMVDLNSGQVRGQAIPAPAPASPATAKRATSPKPSAASKGVASTAPLSAPTTTAPVTTTTPFSGSIPEENSESHPQNGEVALGTPSSERGGRGWAPWVAGGLLLGSAGTLFWRWRRA